MRHRGTSGTRSHAGPETTHLTNSTWLVELEGACCSCCRKRSASLCSRAACVRSFLKLHTAFSETISWPKNRRSTNASTSMDNWRSKAGLSSILLQRMQASSHLVTRHTSRALWSTVLVLSTDLTSSPFCRCAVICAYLTDFLRRCMRLRWPLALAGVELPTSPLQLQARKPFIQDVQRRNGFRRCGLPRGGLLLPSARQELWQLQQLKHVQIPPG